MSGGKEVKDKIGSIQNTKKITRAMEMVAASKMRKAQDRMNRSRPYADKIRNVIGHLAKGHPEYQHPFLREVADKDVKRVAYIVVTTDRGLCGGLNTNLFRLLLKDMQMWKERDVESDLCVIGRKGEAYFKRLGANIIAGVNQLGDSPSVNELIGLVGLPLKQFKEGKIDRLYLVYNDFVNTMTQTPVVQPLLPLEPIESEAQGPDYWDYLYEPDAKELLDKLLTRYIESQVYRAVVENIASEQAAKMVAMKSASDNAENLINELKLIYNKARQAAITQELSEIVAGADAV